MKFRYVLFLFMLFSMSHASMLTSLASTLNSLCVEIKGMVPLVAMLMVVLGAVIYAAGQVMGAETRARANVWATAMIVGAIFAIIIEVLLPSILNSLTTGVQCE